MGVVKWDRTGVIKSVFELLLFFKEIIIIGTLIDDTWWMSEDGAMECIINMCDVVNEWGRGRGGGCVAAEGR